LNLPLLQNFLLTLILLVLALFKPNFLISHHLGAGFLLKAISFNFSQELFILPIKKNIKIFIMINEEEIKKVSELARIKLSKEEAKEFAKDLQEIFENFEKIDEVDTANIEIMLHPIEIKNIFREDEPVESEEEKDLLSNTINKEKGFFKGPKIL